MRAELYSVSQLEQHARTLAGWHEIAPSWRREADRLLARLDANEIALREAHVLLTEAVQRGRRIAPAAEWFVDNYHLIEEQIRTARRHLPRGYNRELPRLAKSLSAGIPRVYDLVLELVSHSHGRLDIEGLRAFVASYQSIQTLRLGELWAIPIMLRLALLENLRRVIANVTAGLREREAASAWVERMSEAASSSPGRVVLVLAELVKADPELTTSFVAEMASRLQGLGPALAFSMTLLEQRLAERGQSIEHVFQLESQSLAADQVSISNSIGSLRLLGATDWREFVEAMSVVEQRLALDPAGVYPAMDFATRDRYRHVVEQIARRSSLSEDEVAGAAVELARAGVDRRAHVGFYLVDTGRAALERAAHMRQSPRLLVRRLARRFRFALYAASVVRRGRRRYDGARPGGARPRVERGGARAVCGAARHRIQPARHRAGALAATLLVRPYTLARLDFSAASPRSTARWLRCRPCSRTLGRSIPCSKRSRCATWPTAMRTCLLPWSAIFATARVSTWTATRSCSGARERASWR